MKRPHRYPVVWARASTREMVERWIAEGTFGHAEWSVAYRPDSAWPDYPWVLLDNGWKGGPKWPTNLS